MTNDIPGLGAGIETLRAAALRYPETVEGVACEGTPIEKRTIRAGGKAFLFLGRGDVMVKLAESTDEVARLAAEQPGRFNIGARGWVTVKFSAEQPPPFDLLERWAGESYRLMANKRMLALLAEGDQLP